MERFYEIARGVIHEELEGEFIVINLDTGIYFGMNEIGADVWRAVGAGASEGAIVRAIVERHSVDAAKVGEEILAFLRELEEAKLVACAGDRADMKTPELAIASASYAAPVLERFEEMRDLLLLDPVHDVDETTGWPHAKKAG